MNPMQVDNSSDAQDDSDSNDIEVAVDNTRRTMAPRGSFIAKDGEILFPEGGNITYLQYLRLAEVYDMKIRDKCSKLVSRERKDDDFLESTHLILFKWKDYFSFPKNLKSNFIYGRQKKLPNGEYDPDDNNRTLFGFRNSDALFIVALAYIVLFSELAILIGVTYNLLGEGCDGSSSGGVTTLAVMLCTLYAGSVASNSYFRFFPFEMTGQQPAGYCVLAEATILQGKDNVPSSFNTLNMFQKEIEAIAKDKTVDQETRDLVKLYVAESIINELILTLTTIALQLCNGLLLVTVAIVMATSPDLLSLIQNFVSVEIVVHIHEFIPTALRIEDQSPNSFNFTYCDWVKELEEVGLLRTHFPNSEKRVRLSPNATYRRIFNVFCVFTVFIYYITRRSCRDGDGAR